MNGTKMDVKKRLDSMFGSYDKFSEMVIGPRFKSMYGITSSSQLSSDGSGGLCVSSFSPMPSKKTSAVIDMSTSSSSSSRPPTKEVLQSMQSLVTDKLPKLECSTNMNCVVMDQQPSTSQHSSNMERKRTHDCVKLPSEHTHLSTAKKKKQATGDDSVSSGPFEKRINNEEIRKHKKVTEELMKEREIQLQKDLFGDISDDDDSVSAIATSRELPSKNASSSATIAVVTSSKSPANSSSFTSLKHSVLSSSTFKSTTSTSITAAVKEEPGVTSNVGNDYNKPPKSSLPPLINGLVNDKAAGSPRIVIKIDKLALGGGSCSSGANSNAGGGGSSSKNRDDKKTKEKLKKPKLEKIELTEICSTVAADTNGGVLTCLSKVSPQSNCGAGGGGTFHSPDSGFMDGIPSAASTSSSKPDECTLLNGERKHPRQQLNAPTTMVQEKGSRTTAVEKILEELGHVSPLLSPIKISSPSSSSSSSVSSSSGGVDDDLYRKRTTTKRDDDVKSYPGGGSGRRNEDASVVFRNSGNATVTDAPVIISPQVGDGGGSSKACRLNLSRLPPKCCAELTRKWTGRKDNAAGSVKSKTTSSRLTQPFGVENSVSLRTPTTTDVEKVKPEKRKAESNGNDTSLHQRSTFFKDIPGVSPQLLAMLNVMQGEIVDLKKQIAKQSAALRQQAEELAHLKKL